MSDLPKGWQYYLFSYQFEGREYSFDIPARSADEARERLNRMFYATYDGELYARIPVPAGGLLLRLWTWLKGEPARGGPMIDKTRREP